jgi:hypothetical protein
MTEMVVSRRSDSIAKLAEALSKAQGSIEGALKDSNNPFYNSRYADLASVWGVCRKPLSENGIAVIQLPSFDGENATVETILAHASGEWFSSTLSMAPVKEVKGEGVKPWLTPQGVGSAISYARRYALASMVGIYQEDDDANVASGKTNGQYTAAQQKVADEKIKALQSAGATATYAKAKEKTIQTVSLEEREEIFRVAKLSGFPSKGDVNAFLLGQFGIKDTREISAAQYLQVLEAVAHWKPTDDFKDKLAELDKKHNAEPQKPETAEGRDQVGTVEKLASKKGGKNKDKDYMIFTFNGKSVTVWDAGLFPFLRDHEGQDIRAVLDTRNGYTNLIEVRPLQTDDGELAESDIPF